MEALQHIRDKAPQLLHGCSVSSDAFGSYPTYDEQGQLLQYKVRTWWYWSLVSRRHQMTLPSNLLHLLWKLHGERGWPMADLVPLLTANPASRLGLRAGRLAKGRPANVVVLDPAGPWERPQWVLAQGRVVCTPAWTQGGMFEHGKDTRRFALDVGNGKRLAAL